MVLKNKKLYFLLGWMNSRFISFVSYDDISFDDEKHRPFFHCSIEEYILLDVRLLQDHDLEPLGGKKVRMVF